MKNRACLPSYRLTFNDAVTVWLRYWNGEFQNRIAAVFDVNPGRINEIIKGKTHFGSREVAEKLRSAAA
jgi:predicted XRE-type DNA-binding protein